MLGAIFKGLFGFGGFIFLLASIVGGWKTFQKAGKSGLLFAIPVVNVWVMLHLVNRSAWYSLLLLIPVVNVLFLAWLMLRIARSFGKDAMFGLGLLFLAPIFWFLLGFGGATYQRLTD